MSNGSLEYITPEYRRRLRLRLRAHGWRKANVYAAAGCGLGPDTALFAVSTHFTDLALKSIPKRIRHATSQLDRGADHDGVARIDGLWPG
jgi:hypothetical protein